MEQALNTVDACLRVYRKAILMDRKRAIVESLRRLVELDSTHDWYEVLAQAEEDWVGEMERTYRAAQQAQDATRMHELEDEFAAIPWSRNAAQFSGSELARVCQEKKAAAEKAAKEEAERLRQAAQEATKERARMLAQAEQERLAAEALERELREQEDARRGRIAALQRACALIFVLFLLVGLGGAVFYFDLLPKPPTPPTPSPAPAPAKAPQKVVAITNVVAAAQPPASSVVTNVPPPPSPQLLLNQMKMSSDLVQVLNLREELREKFAALPFVKEVKPLPFTVGEAAAVVTNGLLEWRAATLPDVWTNAALSASRVTNLLNVANAETSLVAIYQETPATSNSVRRITQLGFSRGQPTVQSINGSYSIEGNLVELTPALTARARIWVPEEGQIKVEKLSSYEELMLRIRFGVREDLTAAEVEEVRQLRAQARRANWRVRFVGRLNCPSGAQWQKNPNKFFLSLFDERAKGCAPLYVLRKENGRLFFKRVLEKDAKSKKMKLSPGMGKQLFACDPLFQILEGDQTVDLSR